MGMNMDKNLAAVVERTLKAIKESGKTIMEFPKESIMDYLKSNGVKDLTDRNLIYEKLTSAFNKKQPNPKKVESEVHHYDEIPKRQPRKNIFSKIERITK